MPNKEIDANVLGKLLFLQSTLEVMPDKQGVIGLVCEGLLLVPGVESVSYLESPDKNASSDELALCIPIASRHTKYGVIEFGIDDAEAFARYKPHIQNVANTIALAFDNRHYISEINQYRDQLEHRVQERTAELANLHIKFEAMTETVSDVLYMIDTDARVIWWNKHVEQITGLSPDELLNRPAADFIHKDDWPRLQQAIERAFATGEAEEDLLCHTINGPVPYHFKGSVVRNNDGTVIGLTGISRDISERNKAEAELLHSEKRLQSIIEGNPVPTIITRMSDGLVKYANQPIAKLFRISEKEVIGKQTPDYFVHPEERALMMRELAGAGKTQSHEVHLQRPDGTLFWAVVTLSAIDFDGEASVMTSVYDTTERKLAEEKLRAIAQLNVQSTGEDFFRVLVESVARLLSVKVAFAAEFSSIGTASARSLAIWSSEELIENMHWTLSGTPCEQVAKGKSVFIAKGVQAAFPDDQWLAEAGLESYLGVPMLDNRGYAIGHIGIMDDKPVPKREPAEDLLSAFAGRATAELERMRTQEALASSEANFRNLVEADCYALIVHRDFHLLYANTEARKIFKVPDKDSLPGKSIFDYVHPRYRNFARLSIQRLIRRNESITPIQIKGVTADGQEIDVDLRSMPIQFDGSPAVMTIIYEITARKRGEYFTGRTSEILEMMATSSPAYEVYDAICRMYENIYPRMRISILKLKGNRLFHCSAPSLPDEYSRAIDGGEIGPCAGSCGTAAFLGKEVIVEDIASDPLWVDYKNIALPHKLRACWSEPVVASDGRILGTLA
ncbi:MAG: PAS domain S-box protein, partial [Mariprofundaceae bacterium]